MPEMTETFCIYGYRAHGSASELIGTFQLEIMQPFTFDPTVYVRIEMIRLNVRKPSKLGKLRKRAVKVTGDICTKCGTRTKPVRVRDMTIPGLTPYGADWLCASCMVGRLTEDISATAPLGSPVVLT